jgi:hypothetical protein
VHLIQQLIQLREALRRQVHLCVRALHRALHHHHPPDPTACRTLPASVTLSTLDAAVCAHSPVARYFGHHLAYTGLYLAARV